jgi:hypothetical protein
VVASALGGNVDFSEGERFNPVMSAIRIIPAGAYAQAEVHAWGEPDLHVAAKQLRQAVGKVN